MKILVTGASGLIGMALRANLAVPPQMSGYALWLIAAYCVMALAMVVAVYWRFRAPAR